MRVNNLIKIMVGLVVILVISIGMLFNIIHKQNKEINNLITDNIEIKGKLLEVESNIDDIDEGIDNSKYLIWKEIRKLIDTANSLGFHVDYLIEELIEVED